MERLSIKVKRKFLKKLLVAAAVRLDGRGVAANALDKDREETVGERVGVGVIREPRVRPVRRRESEQDGCVVVEVGPERPHLAALAEEGAETLLVPPAVGEEPFRPVALEVAPLADEHRGDVELLRHDAKVRAERKPEPLRGREVVRHRIERGVERPRALLHRLVEQVLLGVDVRVERALLDAERFREVADRGAVIAALGKEAGRFAG